MNITKRRAPTDASNEIMTVRQLAEYLRSHPSTIYRLLKNREIPVFRLGGNWRFDRAAIDQWIKKTTTSPAVGGEGI
jgi:excisionase family DNA binding protein